jgi:hypothetical protein
MSKIIGYSLYHFNYKHLVSANVFSQGQDETGIGLPFLASTHPGKLTKSCTFAAAFYVPSLGLAHYNTGKHAFKKKVPNTILQRTVILIKLTKPTFVQHGFPGQ